AAAAALALAGCGRRTTPKPATSPTPVPRPGGTLRTGTAVPLTYGLDPHLERGTGLAIVPRVYGYLQHIDMQNGDAVLLDHAASVEQPDAVTLVFHLRPDVRFQDVPPVNGRAVTAQDVVASVLRYRDNPLVVDKLWHTTVLDRIEALDAGTVRVVTRRPYVYSLQNLGDINAGAILPHEVVDGHADLQTSGAGSGPFTIDHADPAARIWRIARNAGYYRSPVPYLAAMQWQVFADDASKLAAFERRELDQVDNRDKSESQAARAANPHIVVDAEPSLAWLSLGLRIDAPPFNDARVREAIDIAIDRAALIRDIAPAAGIVLGPVNPHLAAGYWSLPESDVRAASEGASPEDQRRAHAKALLAAAGAAGAAIAVQTTNTPRMIDLATAVREQLLRVGLDVRIEELDALTWFVNFRKGAFQSTLISHAPYESPDLPTRFFHSAGVDGSGNMFGLHDPAIDALVERSWGEADRPTRRQTLLDAQRLMLPSRAMLQLFTSAGYSSAWDYVRNRRPELIGSLAQYNYAQWLSV
ncbi:MAG: ABC transporter substrate-binding protein, partial [Dehalococcoidia bacterium]